MVFMRRVVLSVVEFSGRRGAYAAGLKAIDQWQAHRSASSTAPPKSGFPRQASC
jgi:hypothetical protein